MKLSRTYALAAVMAAGTIALSACSDNVAASSDSGSGSGSSKIDCGTGNLNLSGSTAQAKAIDAWQSDFAAVCPDITVNYDGTGSGQGITDFTAGKTDFAGSDSYLKPEEATAADAMCKTGKAINLPMVISPVAIVYNIKGVDKLTLDAKTLAGIFSGTITKWDDPAIVALNKDAKMPSTTIGTVHRSKDSGTTDNFTKFLDKAGAGAWTFGTGKGWKAPGGEGAPDSAGVVSAVKATDGAISYVDGSDAKGNNMTTALLDTGHGGVALDDASVGKAVAAATPAGTGNDLKVDINYGLSEAGAYPAVLVTYEIVCEKGKDADKTKAIKAFLTYTSTDGQKKLSDIGYSPLPAELASKVQKAVAAIS
ncbi:phosphate ABC transporter substrate-binding protein (PhoT family) [Antricoccus suffuscus]|uniref:Phosphate-binding protein n=1 Tax=Antricoccus suffuscus TaxID=1629062 RepID=A0A2T1A1B7_9ACTN|nr:phosphate ABC transporter substrate-binding protein PstS [Antricoccus suffuscus]PRZ42383.1 phosphate ABC transporter substrate-binding protein (PhoT family) [Antricoccus suffuscus]